MAGGVRCGQSFPEDRWGNDMFRNSVDSLPSSPSSGNSSGGMSSIRDLMYTKSSSNSLPCIMKLE